MRKHGLFRRSLIAAISGIGLALGLNLPARSFTPDDAGRVTALLVELLPEFGPFAYDEEEADRIFDEDAVTDGRIMAAGFTRETWRRALGQAFRGFLATIPANVISERFTRSLESLDGASHLSGEQKAELRALMEEHVAGIELMRAEGAAYADMVRPYAAQFEAAFDTGLEHED
ncbi:hypothetical protein ABUE31_01105 [Mesorhizobium sp. ZMM04-5]|uniref:Gluconate 2-dehydrogenase subunit 3 family protein n=1 Tax=Mesorhizobium marinum TaxID=3228790 RepID=A0ABV3QU57_9HYPH